MNIGQPLKIKVIDTEQGFLDLKADWENLENHVQDLTIFQTWVFQYYTWKIFENQSYLYILAMYNENNELVGCVPLGWQKQHIGPISFKSLSFACLKYVDFQNIIAHSGYQEEVVQQFTQWLVQNRKQWDDIELRLVREDFVLYSKRDTLIQTFGNDVSIISEGIAPFITIDESWDDFQSTLSGKRAKSVRYEIRNLFRQFESEYVHHSKGEELIKALVQFMDLHQKRIHQKYQLGAFPTPQIRQGFTNLIKALEQYDYIDIHTIQSSEKTIAAIGTFTHKNKVSYFQGGFDPDYFKLSPGKVVLALRITEAIQQKKNEFDFLVGDEDYKFAWSTGQREIFKIHIKTGSWKQGFYSQMNDFKARLEQSIRFRKLYFKLTGK